MNPWTASLVSLLAYSGFEFYLSYRQKNKLKDTTIPPQTKMFEHIWKIDPEEYKQNKKYSSDKMNANGIKNLVMLLFEIWFNYFGPIQWLWNRSKLVAEDFTSMYVAKIVVYFFFKEIVELIVSLPFAYYMQFVIEERYGFNKMTIKTFVKDTVISFFLQLAIISILMWGLVCIVEFGGPLMPIYCSIFIAILIVVMMLIWPNFIAPLFNKFEPLGQNQDSKELDLRSRVENIAKKAHFPVTEIYKMDGSKRSAHSQAYFFGIFKKKRIVIYDTLINQLENQQTEAVLCHEIGHWFHSHNVQMMAAAMVSVQGLVWTMAYFIYDINFYRSFDIPKVDYFLGIQLSMLMFTMISSLINLGIVQLSRRNEFQADQYALRYFHGENLIWALVKIYKENKADLDPDWLYSSMKHTHPTLLQRVARIKALLKKEDN